jgi:hypothetical protein
MRNNVDAEIGQLSESRCLLGEVSPQPRSILRDNGIELAVTSRDEHILVVGPVCGATTKRFVTEFGNDIEFILLGELPAFAELIINR